MAVDTRRADEAELIAIWEADLEQMIKEMSVIGNQVVLTSHLESVKADMTFQRYELVGPNFTAESKDNG